MNNDEGFAFNKYFMRVNVVVVEGIFHKNPMPSRGSLTDFCHTQRDLKLSWVSIFFDLTERKMTDVDIHSLSLVRVHILTLFACSELFLAIFKFRL